MKNFIEIEETFCGRTYVRMHGRTVETCFIRSTLLNSRHKIKENKIMSYPISISPLT